MAVNLDKARHAGGDADSTSPDLENGVSMRGFTLSRASKNVLSAVYRIKSEMGAQALKHNQKNSHHGNSYTDLNGILEVLEPRLIEHELIAMTGSEVRIDGSGCVDVSTVIVHLSSGEWMSKNCTFSPPNLGAQAIGSMETYGRRYNLSGLFNLRSESDDDGNAASGVGGGYQSRGGRSQQHSSPRKPSDKQLKKAQELAEQNGVSVPADAAQDGKACSDFIGQQIAIANGEQRQSQPSGGMMEYIKTAPASKLESCRQRVMEKQDLTDDQRSEALDLIDQRLNGGQ